VIGRHGHPVPVGPPRKAPRQQPLPAPGQAVTVRHASVCVWGGGGGVGRHDASSLIRATVPVSSGRPGSVRAARTRGVDGADQHEADHGRTARSQTALGSIHGHGMGPIPVALLPPSDLPFELETSVDLYCFCSGVKGSWFQKPSKLQNQLQAHISEIYGPVWFNFFLNSFSENLVVGESVCVENLIIIRITCGEK
jgi:hypothetical protein